MEGGRERSKAGRRAAGRETVSTLIFSSWSTNTQLGAIHQLPCQCSLSPLTLFLSLSGGGEISWAGIHSPKHTTNRQERLAFRQHSIS